MENNNGTNRFSYTYSAKEQAEVKRIREKYVHRENDREDKMERLRRLDRSVTNKAMILSLMFGIVGTLVLGFGMSLAMSEFSQILGSYQDRAMLLGTVIGLLGGILAGLAYPIYNAVLRRERKKIAPEIIKLTDELMK